MLALVSSGFGKCYQYLCPEKKSVKPFFFKAIFSETLGRCWPSSSTLPLSLCARISKFIAAPLPFVANYLEVDSLFYLIYLQVDKQQK